MSEIITLPNSLDDEQALLGSLLRDSQAIVLVGGLVSESDFYDQRHQPIYAAIQAVSKRGEVIDLWGVSQELERMNRLESIGDMYLFTLTQTIATSLNVRGYADAVIGLARRRRMIAAASDIARLAFAQDIPIDEAAASAQAALNGAIDSGGASERMTWMQALSGALGEIDEFVYAEDEPAVFKFGIAELDNRLGDALMPGNMGIVAAKRKRGKSTLMRQHLMRNAQNGHPGAIFSYEEREFNIAKSVLSRESMREISRTKLRAMRLAGKETEVARTLEEINKAATRVSNLRIHPLMTAGWRVEQVCLQMEYYARAHGVRVFEIDYLQLISSSRQESRRLELAEISKQLLTTTKALKAKGYPVLTLLGSQVNDDGRTREAEDPENDCDFKILIEPVDNAGPAKDGRHPVNLDVQLNRHGDTGKVAATFDAPRANFGAMQL